MYGANRAGESKRILLYRLHVLDPEVSAHRVVCIVLRDQLIVQHLLGLGALFADQLEVHIPPFGGSGGPSSARGSTVVCVLWGEGV